MGVAFYSGEKGFTPRVVAPPPASPCLPLPPPLCCTQSAHMGALDSNDINVPAVVYAQDKTLITAVNATHLRTQLFYRAVGSAEVGCLFADVAAAFPPPNSLVNGTYLGQVRGALPNDLPQRCLRHPPPPSPSPLAECGHPSVSSA
jgi:hypothetical protein